VKKTIATDSNFLNAVESKLQAGDVKGAIAYCQASHYPVAKMLEKGLSRLGTTMRDIESAIEHMATIQINKMEKNLDLLSAIAAIAPMLGFLGTVVGMIHAFHNISLTDNISIGIIAGGIYEKMITSGAGLIVGIIAHAFHTYLNSMIDRSVGNMETVSLEFLDILHKPQL
jgi:biopolymer transport protein ExbB